MSVVPQERTLELASQEMPAGVCGSCGGVGFIPYLRIFNWEYLQVLDGKPYVRFVPSRRMEICPRCIGTGVVPVYVVQRARDTA
jgi:hypothetical protein